MDRKLFIAVLVALFCLANVTRAAYRARYEGPRFAAEGAAHFRYTEMVAEGKPIPALDMSAQWPEGLRVFRETSPAMEYLVGWTYRLIPGDKPDLSTYVRYFTAFFFSLAILPLALLSARLWKSLGAGLFTALLFAAALPLVARSSGFDYIRENVSLPLIAFHVFFYVSACAGGGAAMPILSAVFLFAALASWQGAQFYLAPFLAFVLLRGILVDATVHERRAARSLVCAIAAAGAIVPFLREGRFLLSIPAALAAAVLAVDLAAPRIIAKRTRRAGGKAKPDGSSPRAAKAAIAAVAVAAVILPGVFSGRHFASYAHFFDLVTYKLRYLRKPDDPRLLPFDARAFWVGPFNSPDALHFFVFALPMLLLLPGPCAAVIRRAKQHEFEAQAVLAFLAVFFFLFLLMQRLLPLFGFFAVIAAGGAVPLFPRSRSPRRFAIPALLVSVAVIAVFLFQDFGWEGKRDYWRRIARTLRVPARERFTIYPGARDVEGDLLAWISGNVEPGAVVMSLHYLSPQVLTYTGRATNLNDFFESPRLRRKAERLLASLYSSEENLYRFCAEESSDYLLVSCAVGCDPTKDSPLYQAGFVNMPPGCAAYRLMFEPERLARFDLAYENEMYRVFRVGRPSSPRAWARCPLFYEKDLLWSMNGGIERFYGSVMRIYALAARGRTLIMQGRERQGEQSLVDALRIFYFYPAWKALDELYARRDRAEERETAAAFAYRHDANRADVCLALAESRIARGSADGVREILERCLRLPASARDRARAAELLARIE
ncbi:MAG: hypothetical protein NTW97_03100 [Candidatus Krumholzibacteria bacterium]|nr:hypothetical protein [Candidatus Krumholzibacteria bacterium]